jgi:SEC-C motif
MLLHDWLEANQRAVALSYPQFKAIEPPAGGEAAQVWIGAIQPLPDDRELGAILSDLEAERAVLILTGGGVAHDPDCRLIHADPPYRTRLANMDARFEVKVLVYPPEKHPQATCLKPKISRRLFPQHPHLYGDEILCPYRPSDNVLEWNRKTVVQFLDFVSIWLARHLVWERTGACAGGIWLGPSAGHAPRELLGTVGRNDPCPCGSGKKYKRCCMELHASSQ